MEWVLGGGRRLRGCVRVPGDKSVAHRALLLNGLARGTARIRGLPASDDVRATWRCLEQLGVRIEREREDVVVHGCDLQLRQPVAPLYCGNSGTTLRLLCGVVAGQPWACTLTGDDSLCARPMGRVAVPLREMGAEVSGRDGGAFAPLDIRGGRLRNGTHRLAVASAQVKSALLLAGVQGEGVQRVLSPGPSRDHTERLLGQMGVVLGLDPLEVAGGQRLQAVDVDVPGDVSSAAFLVVAALLCPDSDLQIEDVGLNPTRTAYLDVLLEAGARIDILSGEARGGEPRGDLRVRSSRLGPLRLGGPRVQELIDEVPVLAVAAAAAQETTVIRDARELRVKESDRIESTVAMLRALGVACEARDDGMVVHPGPLRGGTVDPRGDHRIAMAGAVGGLLASGTTRVLGAGCATVSFPGFIETLEAQLA